MGFKPKNIPAMLLLLIASITLNTGFVHARAEPIFGQNCNTVDGVLSCSTLAPSGATLLEAGVRHTPVPQGGHLGRDIQASSNTTPFALENEVITFSTVTGKRTRPTSGPTASAVQKKRHDFSTVPGERTRPTSVPTASVTHKRIALPGTAVCNNEAPVTVSLITLALQGSSPFCSSIDGQILEGGNVTQQYIVIEGTRFQAQIWVSAGYTLTVDATQCYEAFTELLVDCSDDQGFRGGAYYNNDVLFHFQARPEDSVEAHDVSTSDTVRVANKRDIDPVDSGTYACGAEEAVQMSLTSLVFQVGNVFCHDHDGQTVEGAPLVQDMVIKDIGFQVQIWLGDNPLTLHYETCTEALNSIFANCSTSKGFLGGAWQNGDFLLNIQIHRGDSVKARDEISSPKTNSPWDDGDVGVTCGAEAPDHTLQQFLQDYGTNLFCTHHEGQSVRGNNVAEFLEIQGQRWQAQVWIHANYTFNFAWLVCSTSFNKILNGCYKSDGFHGGSYTTAHMLFLFQKYPEEKVKAREEIPAPKSDGTLSKRWDMGDFDGTAAVCGTASPVPASKSDVVSQVVIPFCEKNNGIQLSGKWTRENYNVAGSELEIVVFMQDTVDIFTVTTDVCWAMFSLIVTNCSADGFVGGTISSPELHFDLTIINGTPQPAQNGSTLHRRIDFSEQTCSNNVLGLNTQDIADGATDDFCSDSNLVNLDHTADYAREDYTVNGIPVRVLAELVDPDSQSWLEEGICNRAFQQLSNHCLPGNLSGEVHGGSVVDNGNVRYSIILGSVDSAKVKAGPGLDVG